MLRSSNRTKQRKRTTRSATIKWGRNELFIIPYTTGDTHEIMKDANPIASTSKTTKASILFNKVLIKTGVPSLVRLAKDLANE